MKLFHNLYDNFVLVLEKAGQPPVWSCDLSAIPRHGIIVFAGRKPDIHDKKVSFSEIPMDVAESLIKKQDGTTISDEKSFILGRLNHSIFYGYPTFTIDSEDIQPFVLTNDGETATEVLLPTLRSFAWGDYQLRVCFKATCPEQSPASEKDVITAVKKSFCRRTIIDIIMLAIDLACMIYMLFCSLKAFDHFQTMIDCIFDHDRTLQSMFRPFEGKITHHWYATEEYSDKLVPKLCDFYISHKNLCRPYPWIRFQLLKEDPLLEINEKDYGFVHPRVTEHTDNRIKIETRMGESWQIPVTYVVDIYDSPEYLICTLEEGFAHWKEEHSSILNILTTKKSWLKLPNADGVCIMESCYTRSKGEHLYDLKMFRGILVFMRYQNLSFAFYREISCDITHDYDSYDDYSEWQHILSDNDNIYIPNTPEYWSCDMPLKDWKCHDGEHALKTLSEDEMTKHVEALLNEVKQFRHDHGHDRKVDYDECRQWPAYRNTLHELLYHTVGNERYAQVYNDCLGYLKEFKSRQHHWYLEKAEAFKNAANDDEAWDICQEARKVFRHLPNDKRNMYLREGRMG